MMKYITDELNSLESKGLKRSLKIQTAVGGKLCSHGKTILNFSSNDYLNLATDPRLKEAASAAIETFGCGSTASRLMSGHLSIHDQLENTLAQAGSFECALSFGSGFLVNLGVITALSGRGDTVFSDKLNHASLVDGVRLSGATSKRYRHKDMDHLEQLLSKSNAKGRRVIISDSIFSMDGDIAPLQKLRELADSFHALLVIDEAHAVGVFGQKGGGLCSLPDAPKPDIVLGTMSKALGAYGGFVLCSRQMKELFINKSRSFIYSTALPPPCPAAALKALAILSESNGILGETLLKRAHHFRSLLTNAGLDVPEPESQILQLPVGDNRKSLELAERLLKNGILATAIRPPTVPIGTARLRLSVTLAHAEEDLQNAAEIIALEAKQLTEEP